MCCGFPGAFDALTIDKRYESSDDPGNQLLHVETAITEFARSNSIAESKAQFVVIGLPTIFAIYEAALDSAFINTGSEDICIRDMRKASIHTSEIEFLKPERQLSDAWIGILNRENE